MSTLKGNAGLVGSIWPASYYMHSSLGAYTKGIGARLMLGDVIFLACCIPVLLAISVRRPQEAGKVAVTSLLNIFWLGLKEIRSLVSDAVMVLFVVYAFTLAIYIQATGTSSEVNNASIAFVDEDGSALSKELFNAFYPPRFKFPQLIDAGRAQAEMDRGNLMFVVVIPPMFEHDLRAGRNPAIQVNIDATAMQQAGIGAGYIRSIVSDRVSSFLKREEVTPEPPIKLVVRKLFNPNGTSSWFKSVVAIINQITLLTVVLTGAAVIREREHGTLEHLLVMPLRAVRDRDGQGLGQQPGDPARDRRVAVPGRAPGAEGAVRRLGRCCGSWASCSTSSSRPRSGCTSARRRARWRSSRC